MKHLILSIITILTFTSFTWADSLEQAAVNYFSFAEALQAMTSPPLKNPTRMMKTATEEDKTTAGETTVSGIPFQGVLIDGEKGMTVVATEYIDLNATMEELSTLANPLYTEYNFGLYYYQGSKIIAWGEDGHVTALALMLYDN